MASTPFPAVQVACKAIAESRKAAEEARDVLRRFRSAWGEALEQLKLCGQGLADLDLLESAIERACTAAKQSAEALPAKALPAGASPPPEIGGRFLEPSASGQACVRLAYDFPDVYRSEGTPCAYLPSLAAISRACRGDGQSSTESSDDDSTSSDEEDEALRRSRRALLKRYTSSDCDGTSPTFSRQHRSSLASSNYSGSNLNAPMELPSWLMPPRHRSETGCFSRQRSASGSPVAWARGSQAGLSDVSD